MMDNRLRRLTRRLDLLQVGHGFVVVLSGLLTILLATVLVVDLSILIAPRLGGAAVVQMGKALLSTLAAVAAIYWIALPLVRDFGRQRFLARIQRALGRETYLETALTLPPSVLENSHEADTLLSAVMENAQRDLDSVSLAQVAPMGRLFRITVAFLLVTSVSIFAAMAFPEQVQSGLARILNTDRGEHEVGLPPTPVMESKPVIEAEEEVPPPCHLVKVRVLPPPYLPQAPFPVTWGLAVQVIEGTRVEVVCEGSTARPSPVLVLTSSEGARELPFEELQPGDHLSRRFQASIPITADCGIQIASAGGQSWQVGAMRLRAIPDAAPTCTLFSPDSEAVLRPAESMTVLVQAQDDQSLSEILLRYRVEGLDDGWNSIELARPQGRLEALVQRDIPVSSFNADPGDEVEIYVEVTDRSRNVGGGLCETEHRKLRVHSPSLEQEEVILGLAGLRNECVRLTGQTLVLLHSPQWEDDILPDHVEALTEYMGTLDAVSKHMSDISLFKSEDTRRILALPAALDELEAESLLDENASMVRRRGVLLELEEELEAQVFVLDGVTEKVLGEYLFRLAGKVQQELARLVAMSRSPASQRGVERTLARGTRKLSRTAHHVLTLRRATSPAMPSLFSPLLSKGQTDRFARIAELAERLSRQTGDVGDAQWSRTLEELSEAVDQAVRSVEGSYAQSMNRISASFRNARVEIREELRSALVESRTLSQTLEKLIADVEEETRSYIKRRSTIMILRDVARRLARVHARSRKFKASVYLPVDRTQVKEFRTRLDSVREATAVLHVDEAKIGVESLTALTRSMEFSLNLTIEYSQDAKLVKRSTQELSLVRDVRNRLNVINGKLAVARPQRGRLKSLRSDRLSSITQDVTRLLSRARKLRDQVETLQKMFPVFFGRLLPGTERLVETYGRIQNHMESLMLEDALDLIAYSQEHMNRLLDILEQSQDSAKAAGALGAGGAQPGIELSGKERRISKDELQQYLELSAQFGEGNQWRNVIDTYFSRLSQ